MSQNAYGYGCVCVAHVCVLMCVVCVCVHGMDKIDKPYGSDGQVVWMGWIGRIGWIWQIGWIRWWWWWPWRSPWMWLSMCPVVVQGAHDGRGGRSDDGASGGRGCPVGATTSTTGTAIAQTTVAAIGTTDHHGAPQPPLSHDDRHDHQYDHDSLQHKAPCWGLAHKQTHTHTNTQTQKHVP